MRNAFPRVYRSFEEFEREELHKLDMSGAMDDLLDDMFAEELSFDDVQVQRSRRKEEDAEE